MAIKREIKTAAELRQLIAEKMAQLEVCQDLKPNNVYWHEPDETGCNWSLHSMRGKASLVKECLAAINDYAAQLRRRYNLPTPK